jgi:hypothetical protein
MSAEATNLTNTNDNHHILSGGTNVTPNGDCFDLPGGEEINMAPDCHAHALNSTKLDVTDWDCSSLLDFNGGSLVAEHNVGCLPDLAVIGELDNAVSPTQVDKTLETSGDDSIGGEMKTAQLSDEHKMICDKSAKDEAEANQCVESTESACVKQIVDVGSSPFFGLEDENGELNDWLEGLPNGSNSFKSNDDFDAVSKVAADPAAREVIDITSDDEQPATFGAVRAPTFAAYLPSRQTTCDPSVISASPIQMSNADRATTRQPSSTRKNHVATFVKTHHPNPNPYSRRRSISTPPESTGHGIVFHRRNLTGAPNQDGRRSEGPPLPGYGAPMRGTTPDVGYPASFISHSSLYGHQTPIQAPGTSSPMLHMSPGPQPQRTPPTKDFRSHPYPSVRGNHQHPTARTRTPECTESRTSNAHGVSQINSNQAGRPILGHHASNQPALERAQDAPKRKYTPRQTQRNEVLGATFFAEEYQTHCERLLAMARYSTRVWQEAVTLDADCDPQQRA